MSSLFGEYMKEARIAARLSLRDVARVVGVSHVYLGEVERGVRPPLQEKHWGSLLEAIPGLSRAELKRKADRSRNLELPIAGMPPQYQDLSLALARRVQDQSLSDANIHRILTMLRGSGDDD